MSVLLAPAVIQIAGTVIVGAILIQSVFLIVSSFRRLAIEREQRRVTLDSLRYRAEIASAESEKERKIAELSWSGVRKFRVLRKEKEIEGVHSFYLVPHDGKPLPPFQPGQYLTFQLRFPDQPKPIIRCYSLSDSPNQLNHYRVTIKRIPPRGDAPGALPGVASSYFNEIIERGDILDVKAPSGHFVLDTTNDLPVVFVGGGIGITPVLSMLQALTESGIRREAWFFLGVHNSNEHLMRAQLEALNQVNESLHVYVCYNDPLPDDREGADFQHAGFVGVELFKKLLPSNNYKFYICGPPPMMASITTGLKEWGVPDDDVHFEAFGPATVKKTKAEPSVDDPKTTIEVVFDRSGKTLPWDPRAESILEFAEKNGIPIDSGCRAGNCGTCVTAMKSGEVDYVIDPGAPLEAGSCLTCVAVPRTRLTLDA